MVGEFSWQRDERKARQSALYPELEVADFDSVMEVDRVRRSEGREPTTFGRDIEMTWAQSGQDRLQWNDQEADYAERSAPQEPGFFGKVFGALGDMRDS